MYDEYVIRHRRAAAEMAPELGFAIPRPGQPYPSSSLPAQRLALRVRDTAPERLDLLEDALFRAVFVELADVGDPDVLRACARAADVEEAAVDQALADPELAVRAHREHAEAVRRGIRGIPALVVPGRAPLVGAVPLEAYRDALTSPPAGRRAGG